MQIEVPEFVGAEDPAGAREKTLRLPAFAGHLLAECNIK